MTPPFSTPRPRVACRPLLPALLFAAVLAGCQHLAFLPQVDVVQPTAALPLGAAGTPGAGAAGAAGGASPLAPAPGVPPLAGAAWARPDAALVPTAAGGAIFQADRYRPLFENHRARLVGDTLTVSITEKVSAVQSSTSTLDRSSDLSASVTALPLLKSPSALARLGAGGSSANTFSGKGTTQNTNDFSGTITATVVQVLPNGHLVVAAEKQIGVNANVDVLRFSGQVDPQSIAPGNQVPSTAIANVRIEQRGRGQQAESQRMGWLSRFFMNVLPI